MRAISSADSKLSSTARSRMGPRLGSFEFAGAKDIYDWAAPSGVDVSALHGKGAKDGGPKRPGRGEGSPASPFVLARLLIVRPFMDGRPKSAMLPSVVPDVLASVLCDGKLKSRFQQKLNEAYCRTRVCRLSAFLL